MSCGCGGGAAAGGGGRAEWQRIYDRVEELAAGRARLEARNRTQHEFWDARDKINQSRLHQAELSRSRWEAACRELLPSDDPKLAELLESDLEDSRTCEALLDTENSELLVQLKEELHENTADHEHNSGDLISELRKLKQTYETLCSHKDKEATEAALKLEQNIEELQVAARKKVDEIGRLHAEASASINKLLVLDGKLDEMRSLDKENDIQKLKAGKSKTLKRKFASLSNIQSKEAGICVETIQENADHGAITGDLRAVRKLKQAYETLSSNKDKDISAPLAVEDFLLNKLLRIDKDNAGLLKIKEVEAAQANEAAQKLQQTVEELQVAVQYKDDEIGRLRAEAGPLKIKEVEAAQANKAVQMLQQNVEKLQKAVRNKDKKIGKLRVDAGLLVDMLKVEVHNRNARNYGFREEAASAGKIVLTLEGKLQEMHSLVKEKNDEIQKLKNGQPESLKCKCASSMPVKQEEVGSCIDHEHATAEMIPELRKLKRVNKDNTEVAQKLQQSIEELQVATQKKDDEFGRLQAEASASINTIPVLEGDIQKLKLQTEASASINKIPVLEGDIQKLKVGQPEIPKHEKRFQVRIRGVTYHSISSN